MRSWLKAGLIGGVVLSVFTILGTVGLFLPQSLYVLLSCPLCCVFVVLYPAVGVLAGVWMRPPYSPGRGAQIGALAGLVAGVVDGAVTLVTGVVAILLGASEAQLSQVPPSELAALEQVGLVAMLSPGGLIATIACSIPVFLVWAVAWGALGGLVYAAVKSE